MWSFQRLVKKPHQELIFRVGPSARLKLYTAPIRALGTISGSGFIMINGDKAYCSVCLKAVQKGKFCIFDTQHSYKLYRLLEKPSFSDIVAYIRSFSPAQQQLFSEMCILLKLVVSPASNAEKCLRN